MARRKTNLAKAANGGTILSFDENALSTLTAQIGKGFDAGKSEQAGETNRGQKGSSGTKHRTPVTAQSKTKPGAIARGTKRDIRGNAKVAGSEPSTKHKNGNGIGNRAVLLKEILALGGTEEDLDLVADATSDEEDSDSNAALPDKSFRKELASFVAGLGIEGELHEVGGDDSDKEDMGDDWENASDVNSSTGSEGGEDVESTSTALPKPPLEDPKRLIFEARPDWHATPLPPLPNPEGVEPASYRDAILNLKDYALSLLEADGNLYTSKHLSSSSSHRFLSTIMSSGTLSDRVSALTLVVQESPVHTIKSFESLLTLAKKRSRGQAVSALGALKDLLGVGVVLPADRRLRAFATQPGLLGTLQESSTATWKLGQKLPGAISKAHLISWAFEDWLKESYFDMLKVLEGWCNDEVEYARSRAVTYVYELLKEKPEQEANLLRLLVNKLGDPDKKIASRSSYLLLQLQTSHPLMKSIIIRSIESELLLRPGQSSHARYYAINTLNQTILNGKEEEVAQKLLGIYFNQFVSLLKKPEPPTIPAGPVINHKGQVQGGGAPMGKKAKAKAAKEMEAKAANEDTTEKMISAVLTGVNRAFPFSKTDDLTLEKHMDTLFRITHSSNFNTSIQALMLIEQLATSKHVAVDRFFRTLYESLLDPRLITSSKHALYLNLLYRALRSDLNIKRVKTFAKRILQVITLHQPPFICGILYLLRELETTSPGLKSLLSDPEENGDADEEVFRDVLENGADLTPREQHDVNSRKVAYDGRKRDPEHSNADKSCLWELIPFLHHFHPSVSLFATRLLSNEKMPPKPDLASHTLSNFLDRFVYRNAKAAAGGPRGSSIMQPLAGGDSRGVLLSSKTANHAQGSVNTEAFWHKKVEDVAVDEVFFHKYFSQIGKAKQALGKKKGGQTATAGSEDENEENEDEIWKALVDSRPEVEGNSDDESELEMMDLDESEAESSAGGFEMGSDDENARNFEHSEMGGSDGFEVGGLFDDEDDSGSEIEQLFALETGQAEEPQQGEDTSKQRRKKLKSLPTFASVEDYAGMLDNDEDEDL
ncbi:CBF-domain-containing protein [Hyaloscypha bicolor E]|uniref:CBF-domain-containing protein n=1 Tax=Hyaloscypha bicolor E TaxID=1095630 RepID=A0A2J6SZ30_9HELO|nr:CBF-domain-containing protein [Hyaloscypha bicolor E]PMD56016.1 CBF-domain-containing protein [Hyaloscypha bicolor E]